MTFASEINRALDESLAADSNVVVGGQQVRFGVAGMTAGLYEKYPTQFITYPTSEALMNSAAMGLALAGKRPVTIHVRMDFLTCGMDALVNHIPVWYKKGIPMPTVFICQVGKGMGQGPQHSKDLTSWFRRLEGWHVEVPTSPEMAYETLKAAIFGDRPVMYVIHRELFGRSEDVSCELKTWDTVRYCGASRSHEKAFYGD